ncbi:hypothetical protein IEQ34_000703 [Dendrobium chrysotoxum]|uniref:RING-type E3 ubiquitin transferase n=1 Tax=Dendrobium chrysotoxum TaxID=161865 RepID=A0AAV7HS09_DENCH|nr:hypothetical protein IEQ34_000703 [Dendrobium chrysotoxum]
MRSLLLQGIVLIVIEEAQLILVVVKQGILSFPAFIVKKQDNSKTDGSLRNSDDELTCSVCLEQVLAGEMIRSLPCLHQFHSNCIDPWLRQQGTCPVCKHKASGPGGGWHGDNSSNVEMDASYLV